MRSADHTPSVTQADVATRAGVSQALVSIVFREQPGASPQTRERVLRAAADLGYRPDARARLLARGRSRAVGVSFLVGHEFHAEIVEHLYDQARRCGYELLLTGVTPSHTEDDAVRTLMGFRCEALILVAPGAPARRLEAAAAHQPVVVVSRRVRSRAVDVVRVDDRSGARQATGRLLDLGHRDIVHVGGGRASGAAERLAGYRGAMTAAGLRDRVDVVPGGLADRDGERAARELLRRPRLPTAIVAFNDHCAAGVLATLREAGLRVPRDVSVVGFDDTAVAGLATVRLTTVSQNAPVLARLAMDRAVARIEGAAVGEQVVEPVLVERETVGPRPG